MSYSIDHEFRFKDFNFDPHSPSLIICIPAYNESNLLKTIQNLQHCNSKENVGIVIVINASESDNTSIHENNLTAFLSIRNFVLQNTFELPLFIRVYNELPQKKAGVGLARKLAMDLACTLGNDSTILVNLDADCMVQKNYFQAVKEFFKCYPKYVAASIYFEHQKAENEFLEKGIELYEIHLRYLRLGLFNSGYPFYFHTVGSSMAVRQSNYIKCGGMNTRQAGEDFYFLHKLMPLGFGEISDTTVFPEARLSNRVPFGTGKSLNQFAEFQKIETYNPLIFFEITKLFEYIKVCDSFKIKEIKNHIHPVFIEYLNNQKIQFRWEECVSNSANIDAAKQRFWKCYSGFEIIRMLHFLRDNLAPNLGVYTAVKNYLQHLYNIEVAEPEILMYLRKLEKD